MPTDTIRGRMDGSGGHRIPDFLASRERKHGREKVTLTARVGAALCKSASQLSGDTRRQSGRAERGHERCHLISVFGGSAPEDGGLTRLARRRLWERAINK